MLLKYSYQSQKHSNTKEIFDMAKDKNKQRFMAMPIERHDTAAWANIEKLKSVSNVSVPDDEQVRNAKEYVDSNEK